MQSTQLFTGTLTVLDCPRCGMVFGITAEFEQRRRDDHETFYCPNDHPMSYGHDNEAEKLRKEKAVLARRLANAETREQRERESRKAAERTAIALRGHLTRWKRRVSNGVCPVAGCKRHFSNVQRHVADEHADWLALHPEVFEHE